MVGGGILVHGIPGGEEIVHAVEMDLFDVTVISEREGVAEPDCRCAGKGLGRPFLCNAGR